MKELLVLLAYASLLYADYPDQHRAIIATDMWDRVVSNTNIVLSSDDLSLQLKDGATSGSFILRADTLSASFNRGLPSWNGRVYADNSGFKVLMRYKQGTTWSPWLTVGYWKDYIWSSYGATQYSGGYIDYDYTKLYSYGRVFQWQVQMKRHSASDPSPRVHKLSFFASDSRTTANVNHTAILADNPPEIFIPTSFVCQYNVDPYIGGSICSPTSTVLAIRSYGIDVDAYDFAVDNKDTYWGIFGIWPRAVQNAARFGLDGAVTRYRTWSQAYDTLAAGGRVIMSVGLPLYSGHLMMLAGFDSEGTPIVHDPARQNGYSYKYSKSALSESWFDKGGVGYTFFHDDTLLLSTEADVMIPGSVHLDPVFPNPFNSSTVVRYRVDTEQVIDLGIYDLSGRKVASLVDGVSPAGIHQLRWNAEGLAAGIYLVRLHTATASRVSRITYIK
ncbi:MAG: C39 family peptidase [Candidatus Marinimicrobia bacterium]|nr:C39 family peptidase [Candidatus Neomarinimicrobiota bacterium]MCF7904665.1 C39 family peptidase [Candidatus Neomarinimicrobiota bacterium]